MSTDDLTARARRWLTDALPHNPRGLVSELADEVDRLRGKRVLALANEDYWLAQHEARRREIDGLVAERDAARAALGRVRELVASAELAAPFEKPPYWTSHILNALEGES